MKDYNSTYSFVLKEIDGDRTRFRTRDFNDCEGARNWMGMQELLYNHSGYFKKSLVRKSTTCPFNKKIIFYEIEYVRKEN